MRREPARDHPSPVPAATLTSLAGAFVLALAMFCLVGEAPLAFGGVFAVPAVVLVLVTRLAFGSEDRQYAGLHVLWALFGLLLGLMLLLLFSVGWLLFVPVMLTGFAIPLWPRGIDEPVATPLALALHVLFFVLSWAPLLILIW